MSAKYLGKQFDIHGGGMDLKFPHHECEIAQGKALTGEEPVRYWMHTNMLTVNGQKMSKSLNNSFLPAQLFAGDHELLEQSYSPMTVRFFMLQSQYRSTLDFSNEALKAAHKGYKRLANALRISKMLNYTPEADVAIDEAKKLDIEKSIAGFYAAMNDDLNTSVGIAQLFNMLKYINMLNLGQLKFAALGEETVYQLKTQFTLFVEDVLGLKEELSEGREVLDGMLQLYKEYKVAQNYEKVDQIRSYFKQQGLAIRDTKTKIEWAYEE